MKVLELLDQLEEEIESGSSVPLTGKKMLDPDRLLDVLDEIREILPGEFRQAELLQQERERILEDAQKEAVTLVTDTEQRMLKMVSEHEITQRAYKQSQEIIDASEANAAELRDNAYAYAEDILRDLISYINQYRDAMGEYAGTVEKNLQQLKER